MTKLCRSAGTARTARTKKQQREIRRCMRLTAKHDVGLTNLNLNAVKANLGRSLMIRRSRKLALRRQFPIGRVPIVNIPSLVTFVCRGFGNSGLPAARPQANAQTIRSAERPTGSFDQQREGWQHDETILTVYVVGPSGSSGNSRPIAKRWARNHFVNRSSLPGTYGQRPEKRWPSCLAVRTASTAVGLDLARRIKGIHSRQYTEAAIISTYFWKDFFMISPRFWKSGFQLATIAACFISSIQAQNNGDAKDWPAYGGGPTSIHYSTLAQINRDNVKNLQVAWTFDTGDTTPGVPTELEATPIKIGSTLYLISPKVRLFALDAATGKQKWVFDPSGGGKMLGSTRNRGITYWERMARVMSASSSRSGNTSMLSTRRPESQSLILVTREKSTCAKAWDTKERVSPSRCLRPASCTRTC